MCTDNLSTNFNDVFLQAFVYRFLLIYRKSDLLVSSYILFFTVVSFASALAYPPSLLPEYIQKLRVALQ